MWPSGELAASTARSSANLRISSASRIERCWRKDALKRAEAFFIALQYSAEEYIALNATKTATVYRLLGNRAQVARVTCCISRKVETVTSLSAFRSTI